MCSDRLGASDEASVVDAGRLAAWASSTRQVMAVGGDADVPCGACTACCTSWQFVLVEADERDTRAAIPAELLFPAPGRPGDHLLGYDENGHCPMLIDGRCSVYEHRPRTCRRYDCRVFAAADVALDEPSKQSIAARARHWRFRIDDDADRQCQQSLRLARDFLQQHSEAVFGERAVPPTALAALAVALSPLFEGSVSRPSGDAPTIDDVRAALQTLRGSSPRTTP